MRAQEIEDVVEEIAPAPAPDGPSSSRIKRRLTKKPSWPSPLVVVPAAVAKAGEPAPVPKYGRLQHDLKKFADKGPVGDDDPRIALVKALNLKPERLAEFMAAAKTEPDKGQQPALLTEKLSEKFFRVSMGGRIMWYCCKCGWDTAYPAHGRATEHIHGHLVPEDTVKNLPKEQRDLYKMWRDKGSWRSAPCTTLLSKEEVMALVEAFRCCWFLCLLLF